MLFSKSIIVKPSTLLLIILSRCAVVVVSFDQANFDLMGHIMQENIDCAAVIYRLDVPTARAVSTISSNSLTIADDFPERENAFQDLLSVRKSRCVTLFTRYDALHEKHIEHLLNKTRTRLVFVFGAVANSSAIKFQTSFMNSVILVQTLASGNLLLTNFKPDSLNESGKMLWCKRTKRMLTPGVDYVASKNSDQSTLRNRRVTVSLILNYPYAKLEQNKKYVGVDIDIINMMAHRIGFDYDVKVETGNTLTSIAAGISHLGTLTAFQTDIGHSKIHVHHGPQLYNTEFNYLVPRPKPLNNLNNFTRPFRLTVWICLLISWIVYATVWFLFNRNHGDESLSLWRSHFNLFGSMWHQRSKWTNSSSKSSIYYTILSFWAIGILFKGAAYNCNLRAFIVKMNYEKPVESDKDMLLQNKRIFVPKGHYIPWLFKLSASSIQRKLGEMIVELPLQGGLVTEADETMVKEGGVRLSTRIRNEVILRTFKSHYGYQPLQATKFNSFSIPLTISMPEYQPWTDEIDKTLLHIIASGIPGRLIQKYTWSFEDGEKNDEKENVNKLEPYQIKHVAGILVVLASGLLLSVIIFCIEIVVGHAAAISRLGDFRYFGV